MPELFYYEMRNPGHKPGIRRI